MILVVESCFVNVIILCSAILFWLLAVLFTIVVMIPYSVWIVVDLSFYITHLQ